MNEQETKKQRLLLLGRFIYIDVLGGFVLLIIILYSHFSYGWFADNEAVTANGLQAGARNDSFFEIVVRQRGAVAGDNDDQHSPYDANSAIVQYLAREENGGYQKLNTTDGENVSILCHFVNEKPHDEDTEDLAPGAFGFISFDIMLKGAYTGDFDINLTFSPLGTSGGQPVPIVDPNASGETLTQQETLFAELQDMLSGHVLFYKTRSALINGGYYYSDRLTDNSFTFELPAQPDYTDAAGNRYYTVNIYWIWPSTFGQLALKNGDSRIHIHSVYNDETERGEMLGYIAANPDKFFRDLTGNHHFRSSANETWESLNFVELSEAYNRGDQLIGDNTKYLIVCIEVRPHDS